METTFIADFEAYMPAEFNGAPYGKKAFAASVSAPRTKHSFWGGICRLFTGFKYHFTNFESWREFCWPTFCERSRVEQNALGGLR